MTPSGTEQPDPYTSLACYRLLHSDCIEPSTCSCTCHSEQPETDELDTIVHNMLHGKYQSLEEYKAVVASYSHKQTESSRYCAICYKPCYDEGGWKCEQHGYKSVYITVAEAQDLRHDQTEQVLERLKAASYEYGVTDVEQIERNDGVLEAVKLSVIEAELQHIREKADGKDL